MTHKYQEDLPVFTKWMEFLGWLLKTTEKFPKRMRFTLADRIDHLAIDVAENLVEARYTKDRGSILKNMNLRLEKIRILLRLSHDQGCLAHGAYEYASKVLYEIGSMIGGWHKQVNRQVFSACDRKTALPEPTPTAGHKIL